MRGSKDAALAFGLRSLLNTRVEPIGEITDLSLDTAHGRAQLRLALRGEQEAIDVDVREYHIERVNGRDYLTVVDAVASREWLTAALQFALGRRFNLSSKAAMALRLLT